MYKKIPVCVETNTCISIEPEGVVVTYGDGSVGGNFGHIYVVFLCGICCGEFFCILVQSMKRILVLVAVLMKI